MFPEVGGLNYGLDKTWLERKGTLTWMLYICIYTQDLELHKEGLGLFQVRVNLPIKSNLSPRPVLQVWMSPLTSVSTSDLQGSLLF